MTVESPRALLERHHPEQSTISIVVAAVSLLIMPVLSAAQRRTGRQLSSTSVEADGTQTLLCTYLSAVLLIGLVLDATLGWFWADAIAGLVIAAVAIREDREAWRGEGCCATGSTSAVPPECCDPRITAPDKEPSPGSVGAAVRW